MNTYVNCPTCDDLVELGELEFHEHLIELPRPRRRRRSELWAGIPLELRIGDVLGGAA